MKDCCSLCGLAGSASNTGSITAGDSIAALREQLGEQAKIFPNSYNNPNLETVADFIQETGDRER